MKRVLNSLLYLFARTKPPRYSSIPSIHSACQLLLSPSPSTCSFLVAAKVKQAEARLPRLLTSIVLAVCRALHANLAGVHPGKGVFLSWFTPAECCLDASSSKVMKDQVGPSDSWMAGVKLGIVRLGRAAGKVTALAEPFQTCAAASAV